MLLTHLGLLRCFLGIFFVIKNVELRTQEVRSYFAQVSVIAFDKFILVNGDHVIARRIQISFFAGQHILVTIRQSKGVPWVYAVEA